MKTIYKYFFISLVLLIAFSCSNDDDASPQEQILSNAKQITSFKFLAIANQALQEDVIASINDVDKLIIAIVPYGTDVTALLPSIVVSPEASISSTTTQNFSNPINYVVTAQDGSTDSYNVILSFTENTESTILNFDILASVNGVSDDSFGIIDEANKTIRLELPLDADITKLTPSISISAEATIAPSGEQNFTEPLSYVVTAQDGTETMYMVTVIYSQYEVLAAIYNANPNNTLDWNLTDRNISNWTGVTTLENGDVSALDMREKNLDVIPLEIGELKALTHLDVYGNNLTEFRLTEKLWQLTQLETLRLSNNSIGSIPEQINNLQNLKELFLSNNELTSFPEQNEDSRLTSLEQLSLSSNNFEQFPELNNPELTSLSLSHNNINSINILSINNLTKIKYLNLNNNNLSNIPSEISMLNKLEDLDIGMNQITSLPPEIKDLTNLIRFYVSNNNINEFPIEIVELTNLKTLMLSNNNISELPPEIGQLISLNFLNIENNQISGLPPEIGQLNALIALRISNNQISELPQEFGNLTQLEYLYLQENALVNPGNFGMIGLLENLLILDLRDNPMTQVVQSICDLANNGTNVLLDDDVTCFGG